MIKLSPDHQAVVDDSSSRIVVVGGPGCGVTTTLAHRAVNSSQRGRSPLLLTPSRQSLRRVLDQIEALTGDRRSIDASTFLGFSKEQMKAAGHRIRGEVDQSQLVRFLCDDLGIQPREHETNHDEIHRVLNYAAESNLPIVKAVNDNWPRLRPLAEKLDDLAERLATWKETEGRASFSDHAVALRALLESNAQLRQTIRDHHRELIVLRYQDCTPSIQRIIELITPDEGSLVLAGDPIGSIRVHVGATPDIFDEFACRNPGASTHRLERTYTLTRETAVTVNELAAQDEPQDKSAIDVVPGKRTGPSTTLVLATDSRNEAEIVATWIHEFNQADGRLEDVAVVARARSMLRDSRKALTQRGLGSIDLYSLRPTAAVKMALAILRLSFDPGDRVALRTALPACRGVGGRVAGQLASLIERPKSTRHLADQIEEASRTDVVTHKAAKEELVTFANLLRLLTGPEQHSSADAWEMVTQHLKERHHIETNADRESFELIEEIADTTPNVKDLLDDITGRTEEHRIPTADKVSLATIHRAREFRWPVVFVVGVSEARYRIDKGDLQNLHLLRLAVGRATNAAILSWPRVIRSGRNKNQQMGGASILRPARDNGVVTEVVGAELIATVPPVALAKTISEDV